MRLMLMFVLGMLMFGVIMSLVMGMVYIGKSQKSQKLMRWRVNIQALALLVFAILLKWAKFSY